MVSTAPPTAATAMTATTGYSSHRPLPAGTEGRTLTPIQTASAISSGGHTQPAVVSPPSPGAVTSSPSPVAPSAAAGTQAHGWGRDVIRADSAASMAQPAAKPSRADPVMTASGPPPNTSRGRTAARTAPVNSDPAMISRMGPRRVPRPAV